MGLSPFFFVTAETKILIDDVLKVNGYEMIEAEYVSARQLWRVFIDRPNSRKGVDLIGLDDCSTVSHLIEDVLIAENVEYEHLEVSSPGIDRVLTKLEHFERFAGETVKLTLNSPFNRQRKVVGELLGLKGENVQIHTVNNVVEIPYSGISRARVVPKF